ncbi:hypothetical protein CCAX7_60700 [Capsulimonas corticalis]|uniref:Uncharacterized protein n=1 Tax=Capsulimonas corticalis TaxID=2219043 RepID=A0A402CW31_9BACT|nr:hypothetical protein CCAX7_60700 [Capsulimonas corticalis]
MAIIPLECGTAMTPRKIRSVKTAETESSGATDGGARPFSLFHEQSKKYRDIYGESAYSSNEARG